MVTHDLGVGQRSRRTIRLRDGEIESDSNPPSDSP
jgi:predicted ABC-type transport system involved in lysophospholipase L1 biosynthesis ATPase subunit